jgi:hypothetical protein
LIVGEDQQLEALKSGMAGVIFDSAGDALPPEHLTRQLGCQAGDTDVITYAVRTLGFVHVAPIRDALLVKFDPSAVHHLAALAAFYKIVEQAPKRLVLACPGKEGGPDRYQIFSSLIAGLRRVEAALNTAEDGVAPLGQASESFPADRRFPHATQEQISNRKPPAAISGIAVKAQAGDYSERLWKPLDSIALEDKWLGQLLSIWRNARQGSRLPACESIDPLEVLNIARGRAHIVDTRDSDPMGYRFRLWGTVNPYRGAFKNQTLALMPAGLMREDAVEDYWEVAASGVPTYQLIYRTENHQLLSYARLLLPLAADGRRVDQLVVLINERRLPELEAR